VAGNGSFYLTHTSSYFVSQDTTRGYCMTREALADMVQARLQATKEDMGLKVIL
jgi:hypothetical protein